MTFRAFMQRLATKLACLLVLVLAASGCDSGTPLLAVKAVAAGVPSRAAATGVRTGLVLCCLRHQTPDESVAVAETLRNQRVEVAGLDLAGVNDVTGGGYGDGPDYDRALAGRDPAKPVVLLAHQPVQVHEAVAHGVDLQLSGHTHGGQIWPFHYLVRIDQPVLQGLSRHGERTQLYTSRGTGFWGPPFRIFAPSEITLLTLHAG